MLHLEPEAERLFHGHGGVFVDGTGPARVGAQRGSASGSISAVNVLGASESPFTSSNAP